MKIALIPFTGAISEATGTILEKRILRKKKVDHRDYNVFGFFAILIVMVIAILVLQQFFPQLFSLKIQKEALELKNLIIMAFVIIFSILANLFIFYAMKWEKITELEPIRLMQPLFVILLAFFMYSSERQTKTPLLIAALIASLALVSSHIKKSHFKLNKYSMAALFGSLFFAIELVISKTLLPFYSPIGFYFVRCIFIFLITALIFKPNPSSITKKTWSMIFITGAIWVLYRVLLYFSYDTQGVIITTLLFILAPVFIYLFSYIFLKEKPSWRNIISAIIIVACVAYAIFFGS